VKRLDKNQVKGNIILSINGFEIAWEHISKEKQDEVATQLSNNLVSTLNCLHYNGCIPFQE
jgi:hypothetical protein